MVKSSVNVSSITFAQRGRDILEAKGYTAFLKKRAVFPAGAAAVTVYIQMRRRMSWSQYSARRA